MVKTPPHIKDLKSYVAGKPIDELAREKNLRRIVKLASNENPLGPSPKALEAVARVAADAHRYVDPGAYTLVRKIAGKYGLDPAQVICGAGTDSLLAYIIQAFTSEEDEVLTSEGTFIGIYVNTRKQNRKLRLAPHSDYGYDLDAIAGAITEHTKIIYLANPNNPTGSMFTAGAFEAFMQKVPGEILVILDEAYHTYAAEHDHYPDGLSYNYPNLVVTRTFSKDYGLAGFRVGFAAGHADLIRELYKVKLPFEPAATGQAAAEAALDDEAYRERTVVLNNRMLAKMTKKFDELGLEYVDTAANFFLLLFPDEDTAAAFTQACLDRGLILRHVKAFGIPNGVRINSGTEEETEFALGVIEEVTPKIMKSTTTS